MVLLPHSAFIGLEGFYIIQFAEILDDYHKKKKKNASSMMTATRNYIQCSTFSENLFRSNEWRTVHVRCIWNNSYLNCGCKWKWRMIIAVNFPNLSNWKEEAWKSLGFNGIRTRDLRDTGAMLYQLSYEATHWERGQFFEFISPMRSEMMWSIYEIIQASDYNTPFTPKLKHV